MNSDMLNQLGMGHMDIGMIIIALAAAVLFLLILTVVALAKLAKLSKKYKKFMQGNTARSLEDDIVRLYEDSKYVKLSSEKNRKDIAALVEQVSHAYQRAGLVKYDAFNQMGGKLSFCLALLDEENNGFLLNSVHGTEGCYSYMKEIWKGKCDIQMGNEEKQALGLAMAASEGIGAGKE